MPAGSTEGCPRPTACNTVDETSSARYPAGCYGYFPEKNYWYPEYLQSAYCDPPRWVCEL